MVLYDKFCRQTLKIAFNRDQKRFTNISYKIKYNIEWRKSKKDKIQSDSLKRKVLIDFFKLFNKATFLTSVGSSFQGTASAAAKERALRVGSIFCVGGSSRVLLFEQRP